MLVTAENFTGKNRFRSRCCRKSLERVIFRQTNSSDPLAGAYTFKGESRMRREEKGNLARIALSITSQAVTSGVAKFVDVPKLLAGQFGIGQKTMHYYSPCISRVD